MVRLASIRRNSGSDDTLKLKRFAIDLYKAQEVGGLDRMIDELHVKNIALIKDATMSPSSGLTVVTGETGAGKTALLSSLQLLSGERAEASMVREGASSAEVEGRFFMHGDTDEHADDADDPATVVKRTLSSQGRSRVSINGSIASVGELAKTVGSGIDLCGQHEHQRLMKTDYHRAMLDEWGATAIADVKKAYEMAFDTARDAKRHTDEIIKAGNLGSQEVEQAQFVVNRINEVHPSLDEYDELTKKLPILENAEQLKAAVNSAHDLLSGDQGALDSIAEAASQIENVSDVDASLAPKAEALRNASYAIEDVSRDLSGMFDDIDYDQGGLEDMQNRMSQLQDIMHAFGPQMEDVLAARDKAQKTLDVVSGFKDKLRDAKAAQAQAEEQLKHAAHALHDARAKIAPKFAERVTREMSHLQLQDATLSCDVHLMDRNKWMRDGADDVEFMYQPGVGMHPRPLVKIASGGEMSRVVLALKVVLGASDHVDTLVFDEVDAGVGGTAARSIARVLSNLARTHQIIVVTHLAQVAVAGTKHYVVQKSEGAIPETRLEEVTGDARVNEIARMLSGDTSDVSREHASAMLKDAHQA